MIKYLNGFSIVLLMTNLLIFACKPKAEKTTDTTEPTTTTPTTPTEVTADPKVAAFNDAVTPDDDGWYNLRGSIRFRYLEQGTGEKGVLGQLMLVDIVESRGTDTFDNSLKTGRPQPIMMMEPRKPGDIMWVFRRMVPGDHIEIEVRADSLIEASQRPPQIKAEDILKFNVKSHEILDEADFRKRMEEEAAQMKSMAAQAIDDFVEKQGWQVETTKSGLRINYIKRGTGPQVEIGDKVQVHYTGTLLNGKKFDSSRDKGKPLEFQAGKGMVIPGWDEAVSLMRVGDKINLVIPAGLAYGERSPSPDIPPNSPLVFEMELMGIQGK